MDVRKLMDKRAKMLQEARNFLDSKTSADGTISAEDAATYDKMMADINSLSENIDRIKKQEALEAQMAMNNLHPISTDFNNTTENKTGRASREYRDAAITALRTKFKNVNNVLQEQVASDGGYLVPEEWDSRLIDTLEEENIMRKLATAITTSGEHKINIAATKPAAGWLAEGGTLTFNTATFTQKSLDAHKLAVGVPVTNELLYDNAFNLENYIIDQFGKSLANAEEDAFINGTGTNQPTGILKDAQVGVVTNSATAITSDEIINLVYSLKRPYRKNACFIANDSTVAAIRKLKDNTQNYLWQPSFTAGEPDRLLGYPIYTSAYMPMMAADTPIIIFGDISYYNIGDRGVRSFQQLNELFAAQFMTGYVMSERVDGILVLPEAVQVLKMKA